VWELIGWRRAGKVVGGDARWYCTVGSFFCLFELTFTCAEHGFTVELFGPLVCPSTAFVFCLGRTKVIISGKMRSPLPDSSNLEAGIVDDTLPSRLSRVHDNVRDLLRRSVFGSVTSTPVTSPRDSPEDRVAANPTIHTAARHPPRQTAPIPSPAASSTSSFDEVPGVLFPPWRPQPDIPHTADATSQEPTPRDHPDMSRNAMSVFLQQKEQQRHQYRQHKAWKRPRNRKPRHSVSNIQRILCIILGFAVLGLLGTCKKKSLPSLVSPRMLTLRRYRAGDYILKCVRITTRPVRARITPDEHRLRPHSSQTLLSQFTTRKEENRQDRTSTTAETPPPS
jgi:hypothetical protein